MRALLFLLLLPVICFGGTKITDLTEISNGTIASPDLFVLVDVSEDHTKKMTMNEMDKRYGFAENLFYGELYIYDNSTETTISSASAWVVGVGSGSAGESSGITVAGNTLVVDSGSAGVYLVSWAGSVSSAGSNKTYEIGVGVNGTVDPKTITRRKFANADIGAMSGGCLLSLSDGDILQIYVRNTTDTDNMTFVNANFNIHKL